MKRLSTLLFVAAVSLSSSALAQDTEQHPLLGLMAGELDYSMANIVNDDGMKPYFMAYTITDTSSLAIQARLGALLGNDSSRMRVLGVDLRVGDHSLDNTRQIRGRGGMGRLFAGGATAVCLDDHPDALRHSLWSATDSAFKSAVERYQQVVTNQRTMVKETDPSNDFSHEEAVVDSEPEVDLEIDRAAWADRVRRVSAMALKHPSIQGSGVSLAGTVENRFMVSSEGTRLNTGRKLLRVAVSASTKADDGMDISQTFLFNASTEAGLPSEQAMQEAMQKVVDQVLALREAPLVEPYTGPAILLNRASGVFFHEIFGHRIEGHRQKNVEEGQTFTRMIGKSVLPDFLSVVDDPTLSRHGADDLRGYYRYDDEGIAAQRVTLVDHGVLRTFLLGRSPVAGFDHSNGHGRREPGRDAVSRQGNLMVLSDNAVPFEKLREMLIDLCKEQDKPFGLLFEDITGGFTTTSRGGPQAFKVQPVVVYRIYADGRPDELVRGVDVVGTPLSCFSQIVATGDDAGVFNGSCGAESGWVPVSAISPSILVEQIEIEKKERSQERPPLLSSPVAAATDVRDGDPVLVALEDELARHSELQLTGIEAPYFVQYRVADRASHRMSASNGALVSSTPSRNRSLSTNVRVGSYELDNSNFSGGGGGGFRRGRGRGGARAGGNVSLPDDDDYTTIRHAAWLATDSAYKSAVETLTQKQAYLESRDIEDRPADFARVEPVTAVGPKGSFEFDAGPWENRLRAISARFLQHGLLHDSSVDLRVVGGTDYLVNSEGARQRSAVTRTVLTLRAETQADDGQRISDRVTHVAESAAGLPSEKELLADVDRLASGLIASMKAPCLEDYTGPVLFDGVAAPQLFESLLARGIAARPAPVGGGRRRVSGGESLEKLLGRRILPKTFQVWDDPTAKEHDGTILAGHYVIDDEGVAPSRVSLVEGGKLTSMVRSRTPTDDFSDSTGHGRSGRATVGCLYVESSEGLSADELKQELLTAAADEGLDFAIRVSGIASSTPGGSVQDMRAFIARMQRGGGGGNRGGLGDPLMISKVYVADGREEPIRNCEFDTVSVNALKRILAAGNTPIVWNNTGGAASSTIAPPIILSEVSLYGIESEYESKPFLPAPAMR